jgi:putative glutamine amidotransferase
MPVQPRVEVNSFHAFGARSELLGPDLKPSGVAFDGTVEAVVHRDLPIWAIMWHPERPVRPGGNRDERDLGIIQALFGGKHA